MAITEDDLRILAPELADELARLRAGDDALRTQLAQATAEAASARDHAEAVIAQRRVEDALNVTPDELKRLRTAEKTLTGQLSKAIDDKTRVEQAAARTGEEPAKGRLARANRALTDQLAAAVAGRKTAETAVQGFKGQEAELAKLRNLLTHQRNRADRAEQSAATLRDVTTADMESLRNVLAIERRRIVVEIENRQVVERQLAARDSQRRDERTDTDRTRQVTELKIASERKAADEARRETEDMRKLLFSTRNRAALDLDLWKEKVKTAKQEVDAARALMAAERTAHGRTKEELTRQAQAVAVLTGKISALEHKAAVESAIPRDELERQIAVLKRQLTEARRTSD